ncbi:hypothetical protein VAMP_6n34 [Candidatus Vampirococcus lugosii]|uniref:Uncharacterized protein n=2 Tax=Candidatus Vampirococcus lugosii TaxID=2789015 RepID=A0ABS5QJS6_9BACT|nr:hypothetical protein [Candidatus Vampirococcus lugosii]
MGISFLFSISYGNNEYYNRLNSGEKLVVDIYISEGYNNVYRNSARRNNKGYIIHNYKRYEISYDQYKDQIIQNLNDAISDDNSDFENSIYLGILNRLGSGEYFSEDTEERGTYNNDDIGLDYSCIFPTGENNRPEGEGVEYCKDGCKPVPDAVQPSPKPKYPYWRYVDGNLDTECTWSCKEGYSKKGYGCVSGVEYELSNNVLSPDARVDIRVAGLKEDNALVCRSVHQHPNVPDAVNPTKCDNPPTNYVKVSEHKEGAGGIGSWVYKDSERRATIHYDKMIYDEGIQVQSHMYNESTGQKGSSGIIHSLGNDSSLDHNDDARTGNEDKYGCRGLTPVGEKVIKCGYGGCSDDLIDEDLHGGHIWAYLPSNTGNPNELGSCKWACKDGYKPDGNRCIPFEERKKLGGSGVQISSDTLTPDSNVNVVIHGLRPNNGWICQSVHAHPNVPDAVDPTRCDNPPTNYKKVSELVNNSNWRYDGLMYKTELKYNPNVHAEGIKLQYAAYTEGVGGIRGSARYSKIIKVSEQTSQPQPNNNGGDINIKLSSNELKPNSNVNLEINGIEKSSSWICQSVHAHPNVPDAIDPGRCSNPPTNYKKVSELKGSWVYQNGSLKTELKYNPNVHAEGIKLQYSIYDENTGKKGSSQVINVK